MAEGAESVDRRELWKSLRSDPGYVADWRAHGGGALPLEPAPFPLRVQSEVDLLAARWNLLAWEDPRVRNRASPFWADVPMLRAEAVRAEESGAPALEVVVRESGATFRGLRLRDGAVVLKVERRGKAEQVRVDDGESFDPARSSLQLMTPVDGLPPTGWAQMERLDAIVQPRKRPSGR